jgi:pimeloyl-[acyl-carrier protein] methyl ester esterase
VALAAVHSGQASGPALVLVHGWGLSGRIWDSLALRLDKSLSVTRVDLPGHGDSAAGPAGLNNWTDALVEAAPAEAVFLGWSLGGLLALQAARRHPERVRGLILVDTLPRMLRSDGWQWGMKPAAVQATARGLEADFVSTLQEFLTQQVLGEPGARHLVRGLQNQLLSRPPAVDGLMRGLDILHEADLRAELPQVTQPSLLIGGERDRMCHPDAMEWTARQIPQARFWRVARAAHAPFLSHEKQFAERVAAFATTLD